MLAADIVFGLPWLDRKQAALEFDARRISTLMKDTVVQTRVMERRPECLLMSFMQSFSKQ
jgi:hypothetical protein